MNTRPDMICRTCAEPLTSWHPFDQPDRVEWRHGGDPDRDHPPAPTARAETLVVHQHCDFCGDTGVRWIYHADNEISHILATPTFTGKDIRHRLNKDWDRVTAEQAAAIDHRLDVFSTGCADYLELRDIEGLITRLRRHKPDTFAQLARNVLRRIYRPLFRRIRRRTTVNPATGHEMPDEDAPA